MIDHYRSPRTLSLFTVVLLACLALLDVLGALVGFGLIATPDVTFEIEDGALTSVWLLLYGLLALLKLPLYIATIVFFLCWLYRAHYNLQFLKPGVLNFSSGWAVGWWFIPIANLFMPFKAVREVWSESDPDVSDEPEIFSATFQSAPTYMAFWWGTWIISNVLENISGRLYDPDTLDNLSSFGTLSIFSGILGIVAASLAIMLVMDITNRQEKRYGAIGTITTAATPPPPPTFHQG